MPNMQSDSRPILPSLPPRHISRPRLLTALNESADLPLILLSAEPGAGKTVLLTDWALHLQAPVVWLAPAAEDATPRRFFSLFTSALRARPADPEDLRSIPTPRGSPTNLVFSLLSGMPGAPLPVTVIIDDAHVLTDPAIASFLDKLARSGHPRLRLVLAGRSDPPLPLHRYRLAGQLCELRAKDLAMTAMEMRELLVAHGVTLPAAAFATLRARTEGWTAGVRLSAMRMEHTEDPAEFVSELALGQGSIGEYFIAEVLDRQPEPLRRLLIETSFLDEVTEPLAEAITGMDGCAEMLAELARSNSFLVAADAARTRFRHHQLFAEVLRHLLRRQAKQALPELLVRASASFEQSGDLTEALSWAVQAGDRQRAAALLVRGGLAQAFVRRHSLPCAELTDLFLRSPADCDQAADAAEFALATTVLMAATADAATAARELDRAAPAADEVPAEPGPLVTAGLVGLMLGIRAGNAPAVDAAADRLITGNGRPAGPPVPGLRGAVLLAEATTHFWQGKHDDVDTLLTEALAAAEQDGPQVLELDVLATMAYVDSYRSRPRHAGDAALRALSLLTKHSDLTAPPLLNLAEAIRSFTAADFTAAARALEATRLPDAVSSDPGVPAALTLGHAALLRWNGRISEARTALQLLTGTPGLPLLDAYRDIILADIETALGRPHAAIRLLQHHHESELSVLVSIPRARALLALHDLPSAESCTRTALTAPNAQLNRSVLVDAMLCDAQIAQLKNDQGRALEMIAGALEIANDEIVLSFLRVTDVFSGLLARHPAITAQWPEPPAGAQANSATADGHRAAGGLPQPLTQREHALLCFLATSMTTAEIADELCLSVNTVKTHLASIYRKLAARRRREAVLRARQLELI